MYIKDKDIRIEGARFASIVIKDNKVLLIHRNNHDHKYYTFPGGHRRKDEKPFETVIRETKEETNIDVKNLKLVFEFFNYYNNFSDHYYLCQCNKIIKPKLIGEELIRNKEGDIHKPLWVSLMEIKKINLLPKISKEWLIENFIKEEKPYIG